MFRCRTFITASACTMRFVHCSWVRSMASTSTAGWSVSSSSTASRRLPNLPSWHGSELDLGILEAMYLHQCAAAPSCIWPSDIFGRLIREHDLLTEPLDLQPPFATAAERARPRRRIGSRRGPPLPNRSARIPRMTQPDSDQASARRRDAALDRRPVFAGARSRCRADRRHLRPGRARRGWRSRRRLDRRANPRDARQLSPTTRNRPVARLPTCSR